MKKPLTIQEVARMGGQKAAQTRPKEQYRKMANARWNKVKVTKKVEA